MKVAETCHLCQQSLATHEDDQCLLTYGTALSPETARGIKNWNDDLQARAAYDELIRVMYRSLKPSHPDES